MSWLVAPGKRRAQSRAVARILPVLGAALAVAWFAACPPAYADHSLGRACLSCHALRSTKIVAGSRNILSDNVTDDLYTKYFYCSGGVWSGGEPLDCSYCHGSSGDIAEEFALAVGGANGSAHPVDVAGDSVNYGSSVRITCNDCHAGERSGMTGDGVPDLTADSTSLCVKSSPSGYPNHQYMLESAVPTGVNRLADNPPRLTGPYGPQGGALSDQGGVDWTKATLTDADLLCFICHDGSPSPPFSTGISASDISAEYNRPGGGHNVMARGTLSHKLPCYDCHDPHAASGSGTENESLILNGAETVLYSYDPSNTNAFYTNGTNAYTGANDRVVCFGCHNGSFRVRDEGTNTLVTPPDPFTEAPLFPFHSGVHTGADNCLQPNGGCHQSPHNTDFFRCLDCHSTARHANSSGLLADVDHVDSEFGNVGFVTGNGLKSYHSIVYDTTQDMSVVANNGCLQCHDTRGISTPAGAILKEYGGGGVARASLTKREDLNAYDAFCISCHDGTGPDFGVGSPVFVPPNVGDYFLSDGHGLRTGSYDSGNSAARIPCLECHLYHGSTAYKLLPGDAPTTDGVGNVVKREGGPTTGTKFTIGPLDDSTHIDYTDYTEYGSSNNNELPSGTLWKYPAWYVSDYTALWTTYSDDTNLAPQSATTTKFGTSGDVRGLNTTSPELSCGDDAYSIRSSTTAKIGFCNACHFYSDSTDGTTATYSKAYTHEGIIGGVDCSSTELKSGNDFFKDCAECHDPHGSGKRGGTTPNLYMVRGKIKHGATNSISDATSDGNWSRVEFTALIDANSYDEADTGPQSNYDDLCAVCHATAAENSTNNVDYHRRSDTSGATHMEGEQCTACHSHGQ